MSGNNKFWRHLLTTFSLSSLPFTSSKRVERPLAQPSASRPENYHQSLLPRGTDLLLPGFEPTGFHYCGEKMSSEKGEKGKAGTVGRKDADANH